MSEIMPQLFYKTQLTSMVTNMYAANYSEVSEPTSDMFRNKCTSWYNIYIYIYNILKVVRVSARRCRIQSVTATKGTSQPAILFAVQVTVHRDKFLL